jgi:hypothetical protein
MFVYIVSLVALFVALRAEDRSQFARYKLENRILNLECNLDDMRNAIQDLERANRAVPGPDASIDTLNHLLGDI